MANGNGNMKEKNDHFSFIFIQRSQTYFCYKILIIVKCHFTPG